MLDLFVLIFELLLKRGLLVNELKLPALLTLCLGLLHLVNYSILLRDFLLQVKDPFLKPFGHLPALLDCLLLVLKELSQPLPFLLIGGLL